jgi:hypothetical protein
VAVGWGSTAAHEAAKAMARWQDPGAAEALWSAARAQERNPGPGSL